MSTEIKNIIVALRAKMPGFGKTFQKAGQIVGGFSRRMTAIGATIGKVGVAAGAAGTAAAAGVGYMTARMSEGMDATGKLADNLGTTTESLIGLRHAAGLAGASAETMDDGLQKLSKRLGEAVDGSGQATDALDKLGLSAKTLAALPADEQVARIADAMGSLESPAERAAAAADLFGQRTGRSLMKLLEGGGGGIRAAMEEAGELGLTYSRRTARAAEGFQDAMTRVKGAFMGAATTVASTLMPHFRRAAELLATWVRSVLPTFKEVFVQVWEGVKQNFASVAAVFSAVWDAISGILSAMGLKFGGTGDAVGKVVDFLAGLVRWLAAGWIKAITFIEAVLVNWRAAAEVVFKGVALGAVTAFERVKHWLTVALPAYLSWFQDHWREVFETIWRLAKTIFSNMIENVKNVWKKIKSIFGGGSYDFEWKGLTDGFESAVKDLPKIAKRTKTELEKELAGDIADASGQVADYYNARVAGRLAKLSADKAARDSGEAAAKAVEKAAADTAAGGAMDKVREAAAKAAGAGAGAVAGGGAGRGPADSGGTLGRGLSLSAMLAGRSGSPDKQVASNTAATVRELRRMNRTLQERPETVAFA